MQPFNKFSQKNFFLILFLFLATALYAQFSEDFNDGKLNSGTVWQGDTSRFKINADLMLQLNSAGTNISYISTTITPEESMEWQFWVKLSFNTSANNFASFYFSSDKINLKDSLNGFFVQIGGITDSIAYRQNGKTIYKLISGTHAFTGNSTNILRIKITKDINAKWSMFTDSKGGTDFLLEGVAVDSSLQINSNIGIVCKYTSSNATRFYFDDLYVGEILIDSVKPFVKQVKSTSDSTMDIIFSETVEQYSAEKISNYSVSKNIFNPVKAFCDQQNKSIVHLIFKNYLISSKTYFITIDSVKDVSGNSLNKVQITFALPEKSGKKDLIVNEILFNPKGDGVDFVEIFNRSEKVIDLQTLKLASFDNIQNAIITPKDISTDMFLIFPGEYYILTTDSAKVKQQYYTSNPNGFIQMSSLPKFNNDAGTAIIANEDGVIIDKFSYSETMHFPLLNSTEGVSLERISPDGETEDPSNWHSAAESVGFATPAYRNSEAINNLNNENEISISPEIFSPDNDGKDDILNIAYHLDQPGFVANVTIFNSAGRQIKYLVKNQLCGTEGIFNWDGINDNNLKADIGIYIIYIELFNAKGNVKKFKKTAVLAGKI